MPNRSLGLDSEFVYNEFQDTTASDALPVTLPSGTVFVSTVQGISGSITFSGGTTGLTFTAAGTVVTVAGTLAIANGGTGATTAASARTALGTAALGVNTDITQLNGVSQVDVSTAYKKSGTQVVGAQGALVADASGGATIDAEARAAINTLLVRLRAHGLIAT